MSDASPPQGWTNALEGEPSIIHGWLNSTLSTIYADSLADLVQKITKELKEINNTLSILGVSDILWSNNAAVCMKIHVSEWIIADIKADLPPAMSWTFAKIIPNKGDIILASQTAIRAGGLNNTNGNKKFLTNLLIPNGVRSIDFLTNDHPIGAAQPNKDQVKRIRESIDKEVLAAWKNKYLSKEESIDNAVGNLGAPDFVDNGLLKNIVDILSRVSNGSYSAEEIYSLYGGPYTRDHSKDIQDSIKTQLTISNGALKFMKRFALIEMSHMPLNISGIDQSRTKMTITLPNFLGLHPLHVNRYTAKREILGASASAFNLVSSQMNNEIISKSSGLFTNYLLSTAIDNAIPTARYYSHGNELKKNLDQICNRIHSNAALLIKQNATALSKLIREQDDSLITFKSLSRYMILEEKDISWTTFFEKSCSLDNEAMDSLNKIVWTKYGKQLETWLGGELGRLIWADGSVNIENLKISSSGSNNCSNLEDTLYRSVCQISGNISEAERLTDTLFPGTTCARRSGGLRAKKRSADQPEPRPSRNLTLTRCESSLNTSTNSSRNQGSNASPSNAQIMFATQSGSNPERNSTIMTVDLLPELIMDDNSPTLNATQDNDVVVRDEAPPRSSTEEPNNPAGAGNVSPGYEGNIRSPEPIIAVDDVDLSSEDFLLGEDISLDNREIASSTILGTGVRTDNPVSELPNLSLVEDPQEAGTEGPQEESGSEQEIYPESTVSMAENRGHDRE
ncbi:unnamed protein product [Oikopleura dioica]|uniref:Uncharacterized protein n=1 Tax=Oikopleura dioica TaxID=34765 RepID=E4X7W4_OIKDI|nr:unnamed protein product [Oikopleura dioica]